MIIGGYVTDNHVKLRFARSLILGLLLGSLAGFYFGWIRFPPATRNSAISDLAQRYRDEYTVLIAAGYAADGDAAGARERLGKLAIDDISLYLRRSTERIIRASARELDDIRLLARLAHDLGGATPLMEPFLALGGPDP
ncbi:MAG: hypothetical protein OXG85_16635 [Chloroflexi bacterium]|nr:hypothetical protein [Chloroflexota bacterium]